MSSPEPCQAASQRPGGVDADNPGSAGGPAALHGPAGVAGEAAVFGVTLEQIDRLDRLVRTITANGDVIAVGDATRLEAGSLSALGEAIFVSARAVREILDQIEGQRLGCGRERGARGAPAPGHPDPAVAG